MYELVPKGNDLLLSIAPSEWNVADTLDCGQCFRFTREAKEDCVISGVAHGRVLRMTQTGEGVLFSDMDSGEFQRVWENYFDLRTDYTALKQSFSEDETLKKAIAYAGGIRVLRQDSFETLVSFLISQNNNIPRIKASIERLCRKFGDRIGDTDAYAFPRAERFAAVRLEELSDLGLGYRDAYILDCVQRILDGRLDLEAVSRMELDEARETLRTVKGVGPKVAECALLFGFGQTDAFPVDTWMKKVLRTYYPDGFPERFRPMGIAQQYLFHYMRTCKDAA